jgi:hypothetical protein
LVEGLVVLGVDGEGEGVVVLGDAALAIAVLSPNPTPTAAPDIPRARTTLAKRLFIGVLSPCRCQKADTETYRRANIRGR